jgi:hypothetical protein
LNLRFETSKGTVFIGSPEMLQISFLEQGVGAGDAKWLKSPGFFIPASESSAVSRKEHSTMLR